MNPFDIIETERLLIRPVRSDDLPEVYARASDPEVLRFTGEVLSYNDTQRLLQNLIDEQSAKAPLGGRAVVLKSKQLNIGYCGFDYLPHLPEKPIEIFYGITRRFWGAGFATEAATAMLHHGFAKLDLKEIVASVHPANLRSMRVAEKIGLTYRTKINCPKQGMVNLLALSRCDYLRSQK
ncbi:MAG: N-acetyltransferase [Pedosphaera sp.]|nr:N-acetyltransferase [Pedosphaera sp.]